MLEFPEAKSRQVAVFGGSALQQISEILQVAAAANAVGSKDGTAVVKTKPYRVEF